MSGTDGRPCDGKIQGKESDLEQICVECIEDLEVMPLAKQLSLSQAVDFYAKRQTKQYGYQHNERSVSRKHLSFQKPNPVLDDSLRKLLQQATLANSSGSTQRTILATSGDLPPEVVRDFNKVNSIPAAQVNLRKKLAPSKVKKLNIDKQVTLNNWGPRREMQREQPRVVFTEGISSVSRKPEPYLRVDRKHYLPANMPEDLKFIREKSQIAINLTSSGDFSLSTVEIRKMQKGEDRISLPHLSDSMETGKNDSKRRRSNGKFESGVPVAPLEGFFMQNIACLSPTSFAPLNTPANTFYTSREPSHLQPAPVVHINAGTLDKTPDFNLAKHYESNRHEKKKVGKSKQLIVSGNGSVSLRPVEIGETLSSGHLKQRQRELRSLYPMYDWSIQQRAKNANVRKRDPAQNSLSLKEAKPNKQQNQSRKNALLKVYQIPKIDSDLVDGGGKNRAGRDSVRSMSDWSFDMDFPIWESSNPNRNHKRKKTWSVWSMDEPDDIHSYQYGTHNDAVTPFLGIHPDADNLLMPTTIPCKPKPKGAIAVSSSVDPSKPATENKVKTPGIAEEGPKKQKDISANDSPNNNCHTTPDLNPPPNTANDQTGIHIARETDQTLPRITEATNSDKVNVQVSVKTLSLDHGRRPEVNNGTPTICVTPPATLQSGKVDAASSPTDNKRISALASRTSMADEKDDFQQGQKKGPDGLKLVKAGSKRDIVFISPAIQSPYEYQVN